MNWNFFNTLGYISVILWIAMPAMWFMQSRIKPRRWFVHIALLMGVVALVFANINSSSHVERIQPDQSEIIAARQAEKDAKLQAAIESRGEDVADIRFAEDDADDFIDRAGMDESDLKYMDKTEENATPTWQREKKTRSGDSGDDAGLEDLIGAEEETEGVVSEELEKAAEKAPIIMSAKDMEMANRLDSLNLSAIRIMILIALIFIIIDYLRRANVYREAYFPLPLPSSWLIAFTPVPTIHEQAPKARRSVREELEWFTKRGDTFLYLTDEPAKAAQLPDSMSKLGRKGKMTELLRVENDGEELKNEFVFEALWFGQASFVVTSSERARELLDDFAQRLEKRKIARAQVRQTVHVVWDLKEPVPESAQETFKTFASSTGFTLFVYRTSLAT